MVRIIRAEDERRWDADLQALLSDKNNQVRRRAALAAGRIGDDQAVPALVSLLQKDSDESIRAMAAFALGEIESATAADALIAALSLDQRESAAIRSRAVEALGKIAAALPKADEVHARPIKAAILATLEFEARRRSVPDTEVILLGVTAALRARPDNAGKVLAGFLHYSDPRVRADAANTLARLKLNNGNAELSKLLIDDPDPIVRANTARVLGATEDKAAFDRLLDRAMKDSDLRVRVSAIRSLGALKDARVAAPLVARAGLLLRSAKLRRTGITLSPTNELLEIATALGRLLPDSGDKDAIVLLKGLRRLTNATAPEVEIALVRIAPGAYLADVRSPASKQADPKTQLWIVPSSQMQGMRELAGHKFESAEKTEQVRTEALRFIGTVSCINYEPGHGCITTTTQSVPEALQAYAAFKPVDLDKILRKQFEIIAELGLTKPPKGIFAVKDEYGDYEVPKDVIVRATAADLLGELPPSKENTQTLVDALPVAFKDELNDAVLSILDALGKQKNAAANEAIKTALDSPDQLIRRRAVALLKENGVGDFSNRIGTIKSRNTNPDYQRAIARIGKRVRATVNTSRGSFVIEFLPDDAPLTVDNFVTLARRGYFNGQTVPRVVPNFVIQTGDPRGDQNGGPGYSIRCEINQAPYDRGAVGMALSGKDTGGSQWFVTHSPQPHLDGGYTVFGHVISGMDVVDNIVRGDTIRSIAIAETSPRATRATAKTHLAHVNGTRE